MAGRNETSFTKKGSKRKRKATNPRGKRGGVIVGDIGKREVGFLYWVGGDGLVYKKKLNRGRKKGSKNKCSK